LVVIPDPALVGSDRLDSWKAVAEYLGRDVATVRRWEKASGLPIRRVAGSRGHSVFAYRSEIDAWLRQPLSKSGDDKTRGVVRHDPSTALLTIPPAEVLPTRSLPLWRWGVVTTVVTLVVLSLTWRVLSSRADDPAPIVEVTSHSVVATGADGALRWHHGFQPGQQIIPLVDRQGRGLTIFTVPEPGVVIGSAARGINGAFTEGGQLLWFSLSGALKKTFSLDDRLEFGPETYGEPWNLTDASQEPTARRRIAVAAHHYHWWPSMVTVLDGHLTRRGTFVNAGWVERLEWLSPERLLIAGFSNARDGGMVALLDPSALGGQSPPTAQPKYTCTSCGPGAPIRYVVFPRSEVNRLSASPFNRAVLEILPDRVFVRTVEVPATGSTAVDAIYEFTPRLEFVRASFSDRYWDAHRALEAQGKITHTKEHCPDRDGPRAIEVWDPSTGWVTKKTRPDVQRAGLHPPPP